jgi:hypothetical protein
MIVAHVMGLPVEESVVQLVPAGAAIATVVAITARMTLGQLRRRLRRSRTEGPPLEEPEAPLATD